MCDSFWQAKIDVRHKHGEKIAKKFIIMKNPRHISAKCDIFGNIPDGKPTIVNNKPKLWDLPVRPNLVGMQNQKEELIQKFLTQTDPETSVCSVTGCKGSGKSTLAKFAVNCVQDRNFFKGGIIYLNARQIQ